MWHKYQPRHFWPPSCLILDLVLTITFDMFIIHDQETLWVLFTDLETPRLEADFSQEFQKHSSIEEILLLMIVNDCKVSSNPRWHRGRKRELFQELSIDTCMIGCLQVNGTMFEDGEKTLTFKGSWCKLLAISIQTERNVATERMHGDFYSRWYQSMSFFLVFLLYFIKAWVWNRQLKNLVIPHKRLDKYRLGTKVSLAS